jgi:NAD-dependent dihydropyrimidine dehydrogenase PreA subunit
VTYVIAQPCVDVKDRACIEECPVDCIYEGSRSLYIDAHERELGAGHRYTRERVKVVPRDEQVGISRGNSLIRS